MKNYGVLASIPIHLLPRVCQLPSVQKIKLVERGVLHLDHSADDIFDEGDL